MGALVQPDGVPLSIQIRQPPQNDIANNILFPEKKIPSEHKLAIRFGVSRITLLQGMSDLIDDGSLYRRHGIGIP